MKYNNFCVSQTKDLLLLPLKYGQLVAPESGGGAPTDAAGSIGGRAGEHPWMLPLVLVSSCRYRQRHWRLGQTCWGGHNKHPQMLSVVLVAGMTPSTSRLSIEVKSKTSIRFKCNRIKFKSSNLCNARTLNTDKSPNREILTTSYVVLSAQF